MRILTDEAREEINKIQIKNYLIEKERKN